MNEEPLFRFEHSFWAGRNSCFFSVAVFPDHLIYSLTAGILLVIRDSRVPIAAIHRLRWDSHSKVTVDWTREDGQFQQYVITGTPADLDRLVAHLKERNPKIDEDKSEQENALSYDRDSIMMIVVAVGGILAVGAVIWGAKYMGWIPQ